MMEVVATRLDRKLRWGVLGVARIATRKVIPAMQRGRWTTVDALASRDGSKARAAAAELGIPKAYSSYEALVQDPEIEAVYIPLPNHLHVEWTTRAAEAGKHVLCEKPIGLVAADAEQLLAVRDRTGVLIQEAFMIRTHPQWLGALDIARSGRIGQVRSIVGYFSFFNNDPANIRNVKEWGGGGLLDIGCYLVNTARMIFEAEPRRVCAVIEEQPDTAVDYMASIIMDFGGRHAVGTCSTQLAHAQRITIAGSVGRVEVEIPFNAPPDRPCRIFVEDSPPGAVPDQHVVEFDTCDQYTIQGDLFSRAAMENRPAPYPLEDSVRNMRVIDALFRSGATGAWVDV
ncbi:MAG: Gfo/Idh/MocA family protein [Vicinamibacterales bacterium]